MAGSNEALGRPCNKTATYYSATQKILNIPGSLELFIIFLPDPPFPFHSLPSTPVYSFKPTGITTTILVIMLRSKLSKVYLNLIILKNFNLHVTF